MKKSWIVFGVVLGGITALKRPLLARLLNLPPVKYRVQVQRNISLSMPDGVLLAADHYQPQTKMPLPAILIRTPYQKGNIHAFAAQRFAERGYHVLVQDVRGRFASQGTFEPYVHEQADGVATIEWIAAQPWCDGQVGMWGHSYVGYVQWAAAAANPPALRAVVPVITQANLALGRPGHVMLDRTLRWLNLLDAMDTNIAGLSWWQRLRQLFDIRKQDELVAKGAACLPLGAVDTAVFGQPVPFFQKWQQHDEKAPYWRAVDFTDTVAHVQAPAHLVAGWYDIFLGGQLANYQALLASHQQGEPAAPPLPFLTIGPWTHMNRENQTVALRAGLDWFDAHLQGKQETLSRLPVRLYIMGADEWREYATWPPVATETLYYLHENGRLSSDKPDPNSPPDQYTYDPAHPTPHVGGALLSPHAGARDNRVLEARDDVLTFTTPPLTTPIEVIGPVYVDLFVQSSCDYTDFFARLCDVSVDGRSLNVCDGIIRLNPEAGELQADGSRCVQIDLWATAYRFPVGHCLRLQVSSGAHPRFARNLGTGEPIWTAIKMVAAQQTIYHDAPHPSAVMLPIMR